MTSKMSRTSPAFVFLSNAFQTPRQPSSLLPVSAAARARLYSEPVVYKIPVCLGFCIDRLPLNVPAWACLIAVFSSIPSAMALSVKVFSSTSRWAPICLDSNCALAIHVMLWRSLLDRVLSFINRSSTASF